MSEIPDAFRDKVFFRMRSTPWHRYFLLTKRAENMRHYVTDYLRRQKERGIDGPWDHLWFGVTVTNQAEADERIPLLLATPAARRWVSIEPMLEEVSLQFLGGLDFVVCGSIDRPSPQWPTPRREWIENIREQCQAAGVPLWEKNNLRTRGPVRDRKLIQELPT